MASCVFIHGVSPRSGTNYLQDLICLHPSCTSGPLLEDFVLANANLVSEFTSVVSSSWHDRWLQSGRDQLRLDLGCAIGDALLSFYRRGTPTDKILVTRNPNTMGLMHFTELFPREHAILLIRDGRDVVESGIRSFNWNWFVAVQYWIDSAMRIASLLEQEQLRDRIILVRYEDLVLNTEFELRRVLSFIGVEPNEYDFEAGLLLGVRGSSDLTQGDVGKLHWRPVPRSPAFRPIGRHISWTSERKDCFRAMAGSISRRFGYDLDDERPTTGTR
jgi:hypothetical protein